MSDAGNTSSSMYFNPMKILLIANNYFSGSTDALSSSLSPVWHCQGSIQMTHLRWSPLIQAHLQLHLAAMATRAGDRWPEGPSGCRQLPALPHGEAPVAPLGILERNSSSGTSPTVAASDRWEPGAGFVGNCAGRPALTPFPSLPQSSTISQEEFARV